MAVYLDHNATTPLDARVLEAMLPYMQSQKGSVMAGNPASLHRYGRLYKAAVETAREQVAELVDAHPSQVVFTSGGTESNNLALKGVCAAGGIRRIAVSAIEHMALLEPAADLAGVEVDSVSVGSDGRVGPAHLAAALRPDTGLVSVMAANNETGAIQDIQALVAALPNGGIWFHTDASQAAGKIPVSYRGWGVHAMTVSSHKLYGPVGAGALIIDKRLPLHAQMLGGSQERGLRAGTENVPAIVGFGAAAELARKELQARDAHVRALRDATGERLAGIAGVEVFARQAPRLPNTIQFGVEGFDGETLLMALDRRGIAVSSGSACTSGKSEPSHVLKAMRVPDRLALAAVRVSYGKDNASNDVDALIMALQDIINDARGSAVVNAARV